MSSSDRSDRSHGFMGLLAHETRFLFRDPALLAITVIIPAVLFTLFCAIYGNGIISQVPVLVCDEDHSELSRTLVRAIGSSSAMRIVGFAGSRSDMEAALRQGRVSGAFYLPCNMERDIKHGERAYPVFYKNSQNVQVGSLLAKEATTIFRTINGGVLLKKFQSGGLTEGETFGIINPVTIDASVLYNPNFSYSEFLCPGLIFAQLQVMIMIAAILLFNAEYRRSRGVGAPASRGGPLAMLAARSTPACAVFSAVALLVVELLFPCFNIRFNGPRLPMLGLILLFIIASFVPGVLIGLLAKKSVSGLALGILINMPAFIFSGFTFPTWAFPGPLAALAQALPFSHFAPAFFQIALVNAPLHYALPECCRLALFAMAPLPCIVYIFARRHHAGAARPPRHGEAVS